MPTKKDSVFDKLFSDYPEDTRKLVRKLSKDLVPPMEETDFLYLSNEIQRLQRKSSKRHDERDYKELIHIQGKTNEAVADSKILAGLLPKGKSKESSLLLVSLFLFEFEGVYANTLDSFCFQLVMHGHDLFDPIRREFALSSSEIGDVDITTKFKFLDRHNLKMLVRREDQKLRNKIAHYNFSVNNEGNFSIDGKVMDIGSKVLNLMTFIACVNLVTSQALKTIVRKRQAKITMVKNQLKTST